MVYNRPARRLRAPNSDDFGRYLSMLEANQNSAEWQAFYQQRLDYQPDRLFSRGAPFSRSLREHARRHGEYRV